jgi:gliding motility-associated-like protein
MRKIALLAVLLGITSCVHAQVTVSVGTPGNGCFGSTTLLADVNGPMGTQSYTFDSIPYAPEAYAGAQIFLFDDDVSPALPIGFNFCFLGTTHTQFYIGSNGWISFTPGQSTAYITLPIPSLDPAVPKDAIMGPWQDWNPGIGGQIMFQTIGTAPNRKLVVSWFQVATYQCVSPPGSFQIVIHETTSLIENHITDKPVCMSWQGGAGTQGVHDAAGTVAFVNAGRNSTAWTANNESTAYVPDGIVWYLNGNIVGSGDSITVAAGSSGTYIAQVTLCDGTILQDSISLPTGGSGATAAILGFDALCANDSSGSAFVQLNGALPSDYTFLWDDANAQTSDTASGLAAGTYIVEINGIINSCFDTLSITIGEPTTISGVYLSANACDSSATGTIYWDSVMGGTAPYTYSIDGGVNFQTSDTFPALTPGSYALLIMDSAGCQVTVPASVGNVPLPIVDSVITVNPSCLASDGSITVYMQGGGTYLYIMNGTGGQTGNSFGGLGVGSYTIEVIHPLGCLVLVTATLVNPSAPIIDQEIAIPPSCGLNDGSIQLFAIGINPPFEYSIDNGVTYSPNNTYAGLGPGTYTILVRDTSGCQASTTITFLDNSVPLIDSLELVQPLCIGDFGMLTVHASAGVSPLYYSLDGGVNWSQDSVFTLLPPGNHVVTVNGSNACGLDSVFIITVPDTLTAAFNAFPSSGQDPLTVDFVNASIGATSYFWTFGDGGAGTATDTSYIYTPKGDYEVCLVAYNSICSDTTCQTVQVLGTSSLYIPNVFSPNGDGFNDIWQPLLNGITDIVVTIYNQWGNVVATWNTLTGFWDGGTSPDGTYYYVITATSADGTTYNETGNINLFH